MQNLTKAEAVRTAANQTNCVTGTRQSHEGGKYSCSAPRVPAEALEEAVIGRIRELGCVMEAREKIVARAIECLDGESVRLKQNEELLRRQCRLIIGPASSPARPPATSASYIYECRLIIGPASSPASAIVFTVDSFSPSLRSTNPPEIRIPSGIEQAERFDVAHDWRRFEAPAVPTTPIFTAGSRWRFVIRFPEVTWNFIDE